MGFNDTGAFADIGVDDALVAQVCAEYGASTRERLARYLPAPEGDDGLARMIADYPGRGGKMLRPSLCIATARAFGASLEDALPCAAAIELLHNAMLIHDDIEDDSEERRGTPTLHALHGLPLALNAGDALGLLSVRPLKDNIHRLGSDLAFRIFEETERMAWETTEGQALELQWRQHNTRDVDEEAFLTMVLKKTCWLTTIHPLRIGYLIGTRGASQHLDTLVRLGFFFGAAFQIQDDILNLEPGQDYGKERAGDLLEGKRTLMLIHAMREASEAERERLHRFLSLPRAERDTGEVEWVLGLMARTGAIEHARQVAHGLAGAALHEFSQAFAGLPEGRDLRFVRALVTWVLRRLH
ncbi:polyprenyl synthetase family protein [Variovorax dokdonensis]|uniref:Polyprenyl synthetase family protein n=1 Tax=Variovorax dokdonensis TaxID=344883 RepID=A0ABT7NDE9_9BURK|nr:polyprenyl synthetase family protein [Variovorax dokdonensis]MDM0045951.1 polyprenyl synthetase family protein [Variovorax dokdonensis]